MLSPANGNVILVKLLQSLKALSPILVTLFGITILVKPVRPEKALLLILVPLVITAANDAGLACLETETTLFAEPVIFVKPVQLLNASLIFVTLSGIAILVSLLQLLNAL